MKNLLVGLVILGGATVLSHAHAADLDTGTGQSKFMRLSAANASGGVYSLKPSSSTRFIALDQVERDATVAKPIPLNGTTPRKIEPTPLALQSRNPVNAKRDAVVITETKQVTKTKQVTEVKQAAVARKAEPALPLVQQKPATAPVAKVVRDESRTLDQAFAVVEADQGFVAPRREVVVADASSLQPKSQTEVIIRDAESVLKESQQVLVGQAEAAPVSDVKIVDIAPMAAEALSSKPVAGVEPEPIVVADARINSIEPWETAREITGTEREFVVDRSLKRAARQVQAIAQSDENLVEDEHSVGETLPGEAQDASSAEDSEQTVVSLDDEYIPEPVSGNLSVIVPVAKPEVPHLETDDASGHIAFQWPVRGGEQKISSKFGSRVHPVTGKRHFHTGIDIPAPRGTTILAAAAGEVVEVGQHPRLGKFVKIDHGQGVYTIYGHMDRYLVRKGRKVDAGQRIGAVGSTGRSTGPHLHFTVNRNGKLENPMTALRDSMKSNSLALAKSK